MRIPNDLKTPLLNELDFVINRIEEEPDASTKIYFLSGAHGAVERTMRYCLDNQLLVTHVVLNFNYAMLLDRFNRVRGGDAAVNLPDDWSKQIAEYLRELREAIEKDTSVYEALEKITRLGYLASGPGNYSKRYLESLAGS